MATLYLDLETYNETPITHGTHAYAKTAEILLLAYAIDEAPAKVIDLTAHGFRTPETQKLTQVFNDPETIIVAHNSHFDRTVLNDFGQRSDVTRWRDTMVKALAHSLPGGLSALSEIFRLDTDKAKDKEGRQLINLFCKPRPKNSKIRRADRHTHPEEWEKFKEYARLDVEAMREIDKKLPSWNAEGQELALWHLDQNINDRGVCIDMDLVKAALVAVDQEQKKLAKRTQELTDGEVQAASQRDEILKHLLSAYDVRLPDLQKSTVERRLNDPDLPEPLRELLAVRLQSATTSTSKYKTLAKAVNGDNRLRGTLQFCGASRTGRWAGRLFQPQNLPRPTLDQENIEMGIEAIKAGSADLLFDNVMELTSSAIRGCIVAPEGKKLVISDLSNIEGRVLAWLAGENWKLKAFSDFDNGDGFDLYNIAYAKAFGVPPETVDKEQRQVGKVMELALGYEGGVGAFMAFAEAYGIDLEAMAELAEIPAGIWQESQNAWSWFHDMGRPTFGLSNQAFCVCDSFKRSWRYAHPAIASFWKELEGAVRDVLATGEMGVCRKLTISKHGAWLRIRLPSGRCVCYPGATIDDEGKITYMGIDQYTRKWQRIKTYGGKLVENVTQAVARDVLAATMPIIEKEGYQIVLTVHDEILSETPDTSEYSSERLSELMSTGPQWAAGLPLAAAGFETYRYRKD